MVVQNNELEKTCCFYVSDFHLEMILMPYINKRIEEKITILTEKNLKETINILIDKINLDEKSKKKILELKWDGDKEIKENSNIIIIGTKRFIENKGKEIKDTNAVSVLDCYDFEEERNNINDIIKKYNNSLNTMGITSF